MTALNLQGARTAIETGRQVVAGQVAPKHIPQSQRQWTAEQLDKLNAFIGRIQSLSPQGKAELVAILEREADHAP